MKIGIIGVNGFIGRHLLKELGKTEHSIFGFGRNENSAPLCNYQSINLHNPAEVIEKLKDLDLIYYLASASIPASSWDSPYLEIEKNLLPFINFLEAAHANKVKRIVFISSGGNVYGPSDFKISENCNKFPYTPYGINKLTMEYYLNYYESKYNLKHDIYRVSNIYGEGQDISKGLGLINTFLENIIKNKKINVFGDGKNVRNYIYISDVINILLHSVNILENPSEIFNVCSDDNLSINEIIETIQTHLTSNFKIEFLPERKSDLRQIALDNSKIKAQLPDLQFTPLETGLAKCYSHLEQYWNSFEQQG